jgi:hypothetical protein
VYEETDERFNLGVDKTLDGRFVLLTLESQITSEVLFVDASHADQPFTLFKVWQCLAHRQCLQFSDGAHCRCSLVNTGSSTRSKCTAIGG